MEKIEGSLKAKDVQTELVAGLKELLTSHGFKVKKTKESSVACTRKFDGGAQQIVFVVYTYHPMYSLSAFVTIGFDAVWKIQRELGRHDILIDESNSEGQREVFLEKLEKDYDSGPPKCVMTPLYYFTGQKINEGKYEVYSAQDIRDTLNNLAPVIHGKMLPLLDRCRDLNALDQLLNSGDYPDLIKVNLGPLDLDLVGLIVGLLLGRPSVDDLVRRVEENNANSRPVERFRKQKKERLAYILSLGIQPLAQGTIK